MKGRGKKMSKDVVCGMEINSEIVKTTAEYKGITYYFCSQHCKEEFEKKPDKYLKKKNFISRFINWLGEGNEGKKLSCH